jgi:hypothetical protein
VAGVAVIESHARGVDDGVEERNVLAGRDISCDELVGLGAQLMGRQAAGSEGAHDGLQVGH